MNWMRWAGMAIFSGMTLVAGCQHKAPPSQGPVYPPAIPAGAESRKELQKLAPDAVIGQVVAVLREAQLVAVTGIPLNQIKVGDVVTFMGGEPAPVDAGVVKAIVNGAVQVRYDEPPAGGRPPVVGDLVIRFKQS
jgi:hypothetical protein